ncbi:hypothetical protein Taro_006358 [Colocasia esculenta]|uniref:Putative plant transposon protein domain-containing protein n=1 Tax=Colocasia esculenta TaxID=4460 RepID=A0A843U0I2_COLES|nr:hypothetical protein [Colocasia esculenta]
MDLKIVLIQLQTMTRQGQHTIQQIYARSTLPHLVSTHSLARSTLTSSSVDTYPSLGDSRRGRRLRVFLVPAGHCTFETLFLCRSTPWPFPTFESGNHSTFFPLPTHPSLLPFISSSPSSTLPLSLASMAPKQAPRRGARSRATARPIPVEEAPPTERRTKRRHDPAEQPGPSSASPSSAKRGRTSSIRGRGFTNPRRRILVSSPDASEGSSSSSSEATPSKLVSEGKMILKPRAVDLADTQLAATFQEIHSFFSFQTWLPFISEFWIIYPRLVQEFYMNLECIDVGYKSEVKGVVIDMPTAVAATLFKIPDEGADYHNFEFDLHEAYNILTGLQADEFDPKKTHVTKFNTNTFPPVLRLIHHILTTIITPQGGGRDRLTDIQRFVIYCMKKNIKVNLHVIMYQIIFETTRKDLHRSLPYAAHLTQVFKHFGVSLVNEKSQSIPKSNIYYFKHVQKFMGFRLEGDQVRRGPVVVEAPVPEAPEAVIPPPEDQPPANEDQPQAHEDQPHILEEQPLAPEDQPHIEPELQLPQDAPLTPAFHNSSPTHLAQDTPTFTPQPQVQTSYAFGGPSVPPELYSFLNEKFDAFNTSIQHMTENFELKVQKLENTMSAKFIEQKAASDHAVQRFNRLIGTLTDASIELKEHQDKLEMADVFNTKETLTQISKTRLSFAHLVDDLESMKNLSAHIDSEMTDLKKELKNINKYGLGSSSSSAQPSSVDLSTLQYTMSDNSQRIEEIVHTRLSTMQKQLHARTHNFFKGSVDTPHTGVDTMLQALSQKMKKWSSSVDRRSSQVDTRPSSQ